MNLSRIERLQSLFDLRFPDIIEDMMLEAKPEIVLLLDMTTGRGLSIKPRIFYSEGDLRVLPGAAGRYLPGKNQNVMVRKESLENELFQAFLARFPQEFGILRDGEVRIGNFELAFRSIDWLKNQPDLKAEWLREEPKISFSISYINVPATVTSIITTDRNTTTFARARQIASPRSSASD